MIPNPPEPDVRTYDQLINQDFRGGQAHILKLRNLIKTIFDGTTDSLLTWLTLDGTNLRSSRDRASEVLNVMELGAVPNTGTSNFHTVFNEAITKLQARTGIDKRMVMQIPPGRFRASAVMDPILNFNTGNPLPRLEIKGAGPHATEIVFASDLADYFRIGQTGTLATERTANVRFSDMCITAGGGHTGAIFKHRWVTDIEYDNILINGGKHGWSFGEENTASNDSLFCRINDCGGGLAAALNGDLFRLGSGGALTVDAGQKRFNSNSTNSLFRVTGDITQNHNWDGLYCHNLFGADWDSYLVTDGRGIGNIEIHGGQMDGGTGALKLNMVHGPLRGLIVTGVSIRLIGGPFAEISAPGGGIYATGIHICNNEAYGIDEQFVIVTGDTQGQVSNNTIRNGGRTGTSLFSVGDGANLWIKDNVCFEDPELIPPSAYTWGIEWVGATTGRRGHSNNVFLDAASGTSTGTP